MDWSLVGGFAVAMLALTNPLDKVPLWVEACGDDDAGVQRRLAVLVVGAALALLLVALLLGRTMLGAFGIELASFRIGGGIVILVTGVDMIRGDAVRVTTCPPDALDGDGPLAKAKARFRDVVTPIAVPIIAGPGSLGTAIVFANRVEQPATYVAMSVVLAGVLGLVLLALLAAPSLVRRVGKTPLAVTTRFFGLLVVAIAAQMVVSGLDELVPRWVGGGAG